MAKDGGGKSVSAKKAAAKKPAAKKPAAKKPAAKKPAAKKPAAKKPAAKKPAAMNTTGKTYRPVVELMRDGNEVIGIITSAGDFTFQQLLDAGDKIGLSFEGVGVLEDLIQFIQNRREIVIDGTCTK